jgi:hypothetical protein
MFQPKTHDQIRRMFGLAARPAKEAGCSPKELLTSLALEVTSGKVGRISCLRFDEANAIIRRLGGEPLNPPGSRQISRRTVNYRRKKAGVQQIAQPEHLAMMYRLADGRNMTLDGLRKLSERMIKHFPPRTTAETNKIVEALKAMNARDRRRAA